MVQLMNICLLFYMVKSCLSTTSIKTYPTVNLTENSRINTEVVKLRRKEEREMKLILLNLVGFETNVFVIQNESIYTINEIDREQFVGEKRCFDRSYCLIEVHILVNDGEQYWVIPIHIIDENDNKPHFKRSSIDLKYRENIPGGYKIPFEGAIDIDEGVNGKIRYILDCSGRSLRLNKSSMNCFPLFELIILSQSTLFNQYDQLALKYVPSSSSSLGEDVRSDYELILYAIDNAEQGKELKSSMKINVQIEKQLKKPKFSLSSYEFVIKVDSSLLKKGEMIGTVNAQSNDQRKLIFYKIQNKTNEIEVNSLTGELFISTDRCCLTNEINLLIESSYLFVNDTSLRSLTQVHIYFRSIDKISNISFDFHLQSSLIHQFNSSSHQFYFNENISSNEILFKLSILSLFYPSDQYLLLLLLDDNSSSTFSLLSSSSSLNNYLFKTRHSFIPKSNDLLTIRIQHQLTQQWLPNLILQFILLDQTTSTLLPSSMICQENLIYLLFDFDEKKTSLGKLKIIESNQNLLSFSKFSLSMTNESEMIVDDCRMRFIDQLDNHLFNSSHYQLCSLLDNYCYNITMTIANHPVSTPTPSKFLFSWRPIEITIFALSIVFILATITLILIICRLRGIHFCLTIKNYLFYGKKYGLSNAQRLSSAKMTQRVHSIVVRESHSPSIESIKPKRYLFNINELMEQEGVSSMSISPNIPISSIERKERTRSNDVENEITYVQETKQLLEMISSNQDLNVSRLASEV